MPPILKYLCLLFGALTLTKMVTLGFGVSHPRENGQSVILAAAIAVTGYFLLFALLVCFFKRWRNSLTLLRAVVSAIVVCGFFFYFLDWLTPFEEASPLLQFQQILDWVEVLTCTALIFALRLETTKSWFAAKLL